MRGGGGSYYCVYKNIISKSLVGTPPPPFSGSRVAATVGLVTVLSALMYSTRYTAIITINSGVVNYPLPNLFYIVHTQSLFWSMCHYCP